MRKTWIRTVLAAAAAATLVAGVTVASAQQMGGRGGQGMQQRSVGGGGGGGGRVVGGGGNRSLSAGGFSQSRGSSFSRGGSPGFASQHTMRSEHMGPRSGTGKQTAEHRMNRGQTLANQRHPQGQNLRTQKTQNLKTAHGQNLQTQKTQNMKTAHGQNLRTTKQTQTGKNLRTTNRTQTGKTQSGSKAFAQAGTRSRSVSLTSQQRTRIQKVALRSGLTSRLRVTNVNFAIRIGVFVPRSFHLFIIPEDIVFIVPEFRHFRCFVFDDELVIVDPFTFEIVAIIPV